MLPAVLKMTLVRRPSSWAQLPAGGDCFSGLGWGKGRVPSLLCPSNPSVTRGPFLIPPCKAEPGLEQLIKLPAEEGSRQRESTGGNSRVPLLGAATLIFGVSEACLPALPLVSHSLERASLLPTPKGGVHNREPQSTGRVALGPL